MASFLESQPRDDLDGITGSFGSIKPHSFKGDTLGDSFVQMPTLRDLIEWPKSSAIFGTAKSLVRRG